MAATRRNDSETLGNHSESCRNGAERVRNNAESCRNSVESWGDGVIGSGRGDIRVRNDADRSCFTARTYGNDSDGYVREVASMGNAVLASRRPAESYHWSMRSFPRDKLYLSHDLGTVIEFGRIIKQSAFTL